MSEKSVDLGQYVRPHSKKVDEHRPLTDDERLVITQKMFPLQCPVKLSQHAIDIGRFHKERKDGRTITAKLVGYSREPDCIVVLVDGRKCPTMWHRVFWERIL